MGQRHARTRTLLKYPAPHHTRAHAHAHTHTHTHTHTHAHTHAYTQQLVKMWSRVGKFSSFVWVAMETSDFIKCWIKCTCDEGQRVLMETVLSACWERKPSAGTLALVFPSQHAPRLRKRRRRRSKGHLAPSLSRYRSQCDPPPPRFQTPQAHSLQLCDFTPPTLLPPSKEQQIHRSVKTLWKIISLLIQK